jgi:hypothetical protein
MSAPRLAFIMLLAGGLAGGAVAPLAACDLDGLPGFHRANPFARAPVFRGAPAPVPPNAPGASQPADKPQDRTGSASGPAPAAEPRAWERTDNPGPISPEDKALFS